MRATPNFDESRSCGNANSFNVVTALPIVASSSKEMVRLQALNQPSLDFASANTSGTHC